MTSRITRQYSTEAEEVIRNRFENAQATDEAEQATDAIPSQETPGAFRRKFSLKYVPKGLKQDKRLLQRTRMQELEKYTQWGHLRHQCPSSELAAVQKQFNKWKAAIRRLNSSRVTVAHGEDRGKWLYGLSDVTLMRDAWEATSIEARQNAWPEVMLATLRWCPGKASMVLEATMNPLPPGYAIHDVLRSIAQNLQLYTVKNINDRASMADEVLALLAHILEDTPKGHVPVQQSTLGLYAKRLPASQAKDLYDILKKQNFKLHKNTCLQFARRLAGEAAYKNAAYEILRAMVENGATLNDAASASTVTTLLHCKAANAGWSQQVESFPATDALQLFMEHGFKPNTITLTAVLDSLCQQGQTEEAIRLALLFAESGVPLDGKTWTTVFAGAKASLNVENVSKALMVAKVTPVPYESVLSNALHAVFYFADAETRRKREKAPWSIPMFRPMLKVYAKKLELKSLQWWLPDSLPLLLSDEGVDTEMDDKFRDPLDRQWDFMHTILPVADELFAANGDAGEGKLQPTSTADGVMLRAYIRSLSRPQDILSFYKFFRSRLEEQSKYPSLLLRNQGAMIHDTFILVMTEHQELWREALHVFGDMLKDSMRPSSATSKDSASDKAAELRSEVVEPDVFNAAVEKASAGPVHPAPTVFTLTVLLRGLLYQGETALAAQMMQVMRELDIEPNLVTWNTLIRHHALAQSTRMTVTLLQEMEAAGVKPDLYTYNAFNKLRDQDKALKMMQAIVDENRLSIVAGGTA
ncbi:Pentatricopeptide repeat protein [Akanthomyces lecanii RCEF 1005]|uniref:Pentatricopeptide repeat protein n=1 Tax=Akanthomyces lecanii RCEF 1005 TaxID=1081108 RepID=A0A168GUP0_CORDF|nr:Pentatricopeptide repeat protein [Akanthomyces lecanii RCEF 1005]